MLRSASSLTLFCLGSTALAQSYPYTVVDLEPGVATLSPSRPYSISDDGKTIVGTRGGTLGFVWHEGTGIALLPMLPGDTANEGNGVDAAGNACGASGATAVRFLANGTIQSLGTLGGAASVAMEMNRLGRIVGDAQNASGVWHAFAWSPLSGMVDLNPATIESHGSDVNEFGVATGFTGPQTALATDRAFRWSPTLGFVDLGLPGTFKNSRGLGINSAGQVCGTAQNSTGTVGAWVRHSDATGWQYLLTNAGKANTAWKLNDFGQVVGETHQDSGALHRAATYVDGIGIHDLNALIDPSEGWLLRAAYDINERGQIVGWGEHGGSWHGFRLDPNYFAVYGNGCAGGGNHVPALAGFGAPAAGNTISIMMAEGTPNGTGLLFTSLTSGQSSLGLCTYLLGAPVGLPIAFAYDANRQARIVATLPSPIPSGLSLFFQVASLDATAPNGSYALSNGLEMLLP